VPSLPGEPFQAEYDGKPFLESGKEAWALSDEQKALLTKNSIRHVLVMKVQDAHVGACWNNEIQALAECLPWGIPVNISSDPRHGAAAGGAEFKSGGSDVSKWPEGLGIAAAFDEHIAKSYAHAVAKEYRALGIRTALSPQVDVGTEPRWMRWEDTYGMNPNQVAALGKIYVDSLQGEDWSNESVIAMAKHWPGGGPVEGGRDAHYPFGKFAVYPGNNMQDHLKPFLKGVFALEGKTKKAAAIMPYYTVSWNVDPDGNNVGNAYSRHIIQDMLRKDAAYDGVVCTDWGITQDPKADIDSFGSRCYGVEGLSEAQRHLRAIENGVDQFGGNWNVRPLLEAVKLGNEIYGEKAMRQRMEESAVRLLTNMFRIGLFENPYLDPEQSVEIVGHEDLRWQGYEAQLKSIVLLKNKDDVLPLKEKMKVYVPNRHIRPRKNFFRQMEEEQTIVPVPKALLEQYFEVADSPDEADAAIVFVESPLSDGYDKGYKPISLQYRPYRAEHARVQSIGQGDFREEKPNRSFRNVVGTAANEEDLDLVIDTKKAMKDKPVIVVMRVHNPAVLSEMEPWADALMAEFGVEKRAIFDLIVGKAEPYGLLPFVFPESMEAVEKHAEDVPFDYAAYVDAEKHAYGYGYGLNWKGVIEDERKEKYIFRNC
jgi:beta-glucosidase